MWQYPAVAKFELTDFEIQLIISLIRKKYKNPISKVQQIRR